MEINNLKNIFMKIRISILMILSFKLLFSQSKKDENLTYIEIINSYSTEKVQEKKLNLAKLYLKKAKNEESNIQISKAYYLHALLYYESAKKEDKLKIISYLDSVINYSKTEQDPSFPMAAYSEKARFLSELNNYEESIKVYKQGEKIALERNSPHYYNIRHSIATIKCENLGEIDEALIIFKECEKKLRPNKNKFQNVYLATLFGIADVFNSKKLKDSCKKYCIKGINESKLSKDEEMMNKFRLLKAANLIQFKKHDSAISTILSVKPYIYNKLKHTLNTLACEYYLGKAYFETNKKEKAIAHFKSVDSIYQKTKSITPEFVDTYKIIIDYYKEKNDYKNQSKYYNTFLEIEEEFKEKYRKFYPILQKQYDIPHIFEEKNKIINVQNTILYIALFIILLLILVLFIFKRKEREKLLKFKNLLEESSHWQKYPLQLIDGNTIDNENLELKEVTKEIIKKPSEIKDEIIEDILERLDQFEKEKGFLQKSISAKILADEFGTNVKYLSNVINIYKKKKFTNYINDLRIEYSILMLKNDKKLIHYTIESLADEFGFNNLASFNNAFNSFANMKPTFFINQIKNKSA